MYYERFMVNGSRFQPNQQFLSELNTDAIATEASEVTRAKCNAMYDALLEFYASLDAMPIEAIILQKYSRDQFADHVELSGINGVELFRVDKRLIAEPEHLWVKTGLGLGPVERAYNAAISRLEPICKDHGVSLIGHNNSKSFEFGYTYTYVCN